MAFLRSKTKPTRGDRDADEREHERRDEAREDAGAFDHAEHQHGKHTWIGEDGRDARRWEYEPEAPATSARPSSLMRPGGYAAAQCIFSASFSWRHHWSAPVKSRTSAANPCAPERNGHDDRSVRVTSSESVESLRPNSSSDV
jgi:hypothetical protein